MPCQHVPMPVGGTAIVCTLNRRLEPSDGVPAETMEAIVGLVARTYPSTGLHFETALSLAVSTAWAAARAAVDVAAEAAIAAQLEEPPAMLVVQAGGHWRATAILAAGAQAIVGPSSSYGSSPTAAVDQLLGRRFVILADQDCPTTVVAISALEDLAPAPAEDVAA